MEHPTAVADALSASCYQAYIVGGDGIERLKCRRSFFFVSSDPLTLLLVSACCMFLLLMLVFLITIY